MGSPLSTLGRKRSFISDPRKNEGFYCLGHPWPHRIRISRSPATDFLWCGPLGGGYIVGTAPALVLKAANFAAKVHKGQVSEQDETIPFINHAIGIADILANVGKETDPVLLQASILHDSVEYTDTTIELLRKEFGAMVAHLVAEVTPKEDGGLFEESEAANVSPSAKKLFLADNLWYLTALDQKEGELTPEEESAFSEATKKLQPFFGMSKPIEDKIMALIEKHA